MATITLTPPSEPAALDELLSVLEDALNELDTVAAHVAAHADRARSEDRTQAHEALADLHERIGGAWALAATASRDLAALGDGTTPGTAQDACRNHVAPCVDPSSCPWPCAPTDDDDAVHAEATRREQSLDAVL